MIAYSEVSFLFLTLFMVLGLTLLFFGGESLCKGAEKLALSYKVDPLIVGLTIVSIATSMPELITSFYGAMNEGDGIAIGNIVGSNLANIGLILPIAALIAPLDIHTRLIKKELPVLIGVSALFTLMCWTQPLSRLEGIVLLIGMIAYIAILIKWARGEKAILSQVISSEASSGKISRFYCWLFIALGGTLLHFGADFLVNASIQIAQRLGVNEVLVGLTVVAVGTSLPELAASIAASRRGQTDICAGNLIGSNLFNILLIGGSVSSIFTLKVEKNLFRIEFPAMILLTGLVWYFFSTHKKLTRKEALFLLLVYSLVIALSAFSNLKIF